MAAAPSAAYDDELVELGLAADLDEATMKLFLSDGEAGGAAASSWPAEQLRSELVREDELQSLCKCDYSYAVPRKYTPGRAGDLGPCSPPPPGSNAICVYAAAFEAGVRFPLHEFYVSLLQHYNLAPSQLTPNAWSYMADFVRLCEDAGVVPMVSVFRYFSIYGHSGDSLGWYHFSPCAVTPYPDRRRLFAGLLPARHKWRLRFFFLEPPPETPWPFPTRWGKPRRAAVRRTALETMSSDARMAAFVLLKKVESEKLGAASTGINIGRVVFHTDRSLPVAPVKAEARAAPAAGDSGDVARKRKSPAAATTPSPTTQQHHHQSQSFAAMGTPSGMAAVPPDKSSFVVATGNTGEISLPLPPGVWASDAVQLWDAMDAEKARLQADLQAANVRIAELQGQLRETKDWNTKFMDYVRAAGAEAAQLKADYTAEVAKIQLGHAAEVADLNRMHAAVVAELNKEHAAANAELTKKLEDDMARVKDAVEEEVLEAKKEMVLALFPGLDASLLERTKLKGDPENLLR
ncbi:unnamed protein product [Urochloa humidicola]